MLNAGSVRESLLKSDVSICIIAADEENVCVSVRVPKKSISPNLIALAAIAEMAGDAHSDGSFIDPSTRPTAKRRWFRFYSRVSLLQTAAIVTLAAIVLPLSMTFGQIHAPKQSEPTQPPPVKVFSVTLETPVVVEGGELIVTPVVQRTRLCPQIMRTAYTRVADGATISRTEDVGGSVGITEKPVPYRVAVRLPTSLIAGDYKYRRVAFDTCDGQTFATVVADDLPFKVVAAVPTHADNLAH